MNMAGSLFLKYMFLVDNLQDNFLDKDIDQRDMSQMHRRHKLIQEHLVFDLINKKEHRIQMNK
jgi:hypothetical protein